MSEGGTTRYGETGCSAAIRPAMRQSQREVTSVTVGSRYKPRNNMAVLNTPEPSLSLLFRTSRAADATTRCGLSPRCDVAIIRCSVTSNGLAGSDKKFAAPPAFYLRPHTERAGWHRPAARDWFSPNDCAASTRQSVSRYQPRLP